MNIFEKETGFIGDAPLEHLKKGWDDFWLQARSIRKQLGMKVYLFDNYLELLFNSVNNILAQDAAGEGFDKLTKQRGLLAEICEGKTDSQNHALYEKAKVCIDEFVVGYQERTTQHSLYMVGFTNDALEYETNVYIKNGTDDFSGDIDFIKINNLYGKICIQLGGEEQMEKLNFLFKQRFILVSPMMMFLQGFNNDLIYILTHRDDETHQQVFQLFLEDLEERQ